MARPSSIVAFERLYLGSFVVWVIGLVVFWAQFQHNIAVSAAHAPGTIGRIMPGIANTMVLLVGVVTLLLWYLVARRASRAAAWVVIITEAFSLLSTLYSLVHLVRIGHGYQANGWVNLVASIMAIAAAVMLMRPDARAWLAGSRRAPGVEVL